MITLHVEVDGDQVLDVRYDGTGCLVSQGCAALLCERSTGKAVKELTSQTAAVLLDFDYTQLSLHRQACALLGYDILQRKLSELRTTRDESARREHD